MDDRGQPQTLTWSEVDPARHPFDPADAHAIALAHPSGDARAREDAITDALLDRYGRWAAGWRWARGVGGIGGGPVSAWCCATHSCTTPGETADRVQAALSEWRAWIEQLSARFESLLTTDANEAYVDAFQDAVSLIVLDVVERTGAGDAWYAHAAQVLTWFLERSGIDDTRAKELVSASIGGRFQSWTGPDRLLVEDVGRALATSALR